MEEGGAHSEKLSKNADVSQDTHYPRNFEMSAFSHSPQAGKNLHRQYQGGSQSVLSEVAFFFLPTDIFRIKRMFLEGGDGERAVLLFGNVQGSLRKDGTSVTLCLGGSKAMWGWDSW